MFEMPDDEHEHHPHCHHDVPEGFALVSIDLLEVLREWWDDRRPLDEHHVTVEDIDIVDTITDFLDELPSEGIDEHGNYTVAFNDGLMSKTSLEGDRGAVFSDDGVYRYLLYRRWDTSLPVLGWLMLNPSVADADTDDPTVTKCIGFAERNGFGGIAIANLYAAVTTDPKVLAEMKDPFGSENVQALGIFMHAIDELWLAWGNGMNQVHPADEADANVLIQQVCQAAWHHDLPVHCLGMTKLGNPRHPGRIAYSTEPVLVDIEPPSTSVHDN